MGVGGGRGRAWRARLRIGRVDPALTACAAWLVALPLLAAGTAALEPQTPREAMAVPSGDPSAAAARVRAVPIFLGGAAPPDATLSSARLLREEIAKRARDLLGRDGGDRLLALVGQEKALRADEEEWYDPNPTYPYRYPKLDALLDQQLPPALVRRSADDVNDLAVLLIQGATLAELAVGHPLGHAGSAAFALLHRVAAATPGECGPQLNLGLLVAADAIPREKVAKRVLREAATRCPGDPTPLWLLGQLESLQATVPLIDPPPGVEVPTLAEELEAPLATFGELRRRFPGSATGWAGVADVELRIAYQLGHARPFEAATHFRRALALYREGRRLDRDPELLPGIARAHAGLNQPRLAAAAQRAAVMALDGGAPLQAPLVEYLERAHRFRGAAIEAERLAADARFPVGSGFVPRSSDNFTLFEDDAEEPLSIGAGRFDAVEISLGVYPGGGGDGVSDLAFLPDYRTEYWVTGHNRWCPAWAASRNRILSGRPGAAIDDLLAGKLDDIRPGYDWECGYSLELLAGIGGSESGDVSRGRELTATGDYSDRRLPAARLHDARQNLWRFAGDLDRARRAANDWRAATPRSTLAYDRSGEIEFLDGDYAEAVKLFARAASNARAERGLASVAEAEALVKQGVALARLDRLRSALGTLTQAELVAARARGMAEQFPGEEWTDSSDEADYMHYHALSQIGYAALAAQRYERAVDAYEAAGALAEDLYYVPDPERGGGGRAEVALNNLALAQARVGRLRDAERSASAAVVHDRASPFSLGTLGFVQAARGKHGQARRTLTSTLRRFPGQYTAWSNLGVLEAEAGDLEAATAAFRRAVGADDDYALGWFNLGVALERQGPLHALQSQGAFGRAIDADPDLAGREHRLSLDRDVYLSELDVSKPLPAGWTFAEAGAPAAAGAATGVLFLLIGGLQLGRSAAGQTLTSAARPLLELARGALSWLGGAQPYLSAGAALTVTAGVFLVALIRAGGATPVQVLLLLSGLAALMGIAWRARVLVARRDGVTLTQRGWRPSMIVGLGASLFGVPWAPLPVAETNGRAAAVHWAAPVAMAVAALVLLTLTAWLAIPVTRALGTAALVMTASLLVPLAPLDGGELDRLQGSRSVGLALAGSGLALLLGVA